ncbi:9524_t:CDS:2, partial [Dentiscutata heterogama]
MLIKKKKIRGVNLGGWLVFEGWIRPSLFEQFSPKDQVVDEYTFTKFLGYEEAKRQLHNYWSFWITEHDIKKLASYGLNHL